MRNLRKLHKEHHTLSKIEQTHLEKKTGHTHITSNLRKVRANTENTFLKKKKQTLKISHLNKEKANTENIALKQRKSKHREHRTQT